MSAENSGNAARASVLAGIASVVTLPLAVYVTRFSERYDLLHAGFFIPVTAVLGLVALALARRERRRRAVSLATAGPSRDLATMGRVLGALGLCLAASAMIAMVVYGLLEYVGSRE